MGIDSKVVFVGFCRSRLGTAGVVLVLTLALSHAMFVLLAAAIARGATSSVVFGAFFATGALALLSEAACLVAYEVNMGRVQLGCFEVRS